MAAPGSLLLLLPLPLWFILLGRAVVCVGE